MTSLLRDARHSARALLKNPGLSAISILALGLGIGVTATMFSIVYGAMLRGLPFERGHRIYDISRYNVVENDDQDTPVHDYLDWRAQQTSFEDIGAFYNGTVTIAGSDGATRHSGAFLTASTLRLLGVPPVLGRVFTDEEDEPGAPSVIVIGYHVWRDLYQNDPGIIGEVVRVNGEQATVIGVMPEGFRFPVLQDTWMPMRPDTTVARGRGNWMNVVGLLPEGGDLGAAQAEFEGIAAQLALEYPQTNENLSVVVKPYTEEFIGDDESAMLWTMLGAVFAVLAIACANVANLLVSRAFDRSKEVAIRTALGASRTRVVSQILLETAMLAAIGAWLGTAFAVVGVNWFNGAIAGTGAPFFIDIRVDAPIWLFVVATTSLATLLAGVLPAVQVLRGNLNEVLGDESRGSSSFRLGRVSRGLVIAQVAVSCALLVAAGLMIRSIVNLGTTDYGFDPDTILTARFNISADDYPDTAVREALYDELLRRLDNHPGVESAALTTALPVSQTGNRRFRVEGDTYAEDAERPDANVATVTPGVFETFGVELIGGRDFDARDTRDELPVMIVNETFVERYLDGRNPLGTRVEFGTGDDEETVWRTIIGVAPDLFMDGPKNESPDGFYVPLSQGDTRSMGIALRTRADAISFAPELRREVMAIDRDIPLFDLLTMSGQIRDRTWFYWVFGTLFGVFGAAALVLASVGLYGVMAFAVRRRTGEVGIRMALGAGSAGVLRLVMRQGLFQLGLGLGIGLLMAAGMASALEVLLFQVEPGDPVTFIAIAATLLATGLTATLIPALRASRIDPMIALRKQ